MDRQQVCHERIDSGDDGAVKACERGQQGPANGGERHWREPFAKSVTLFSRRQFCPGAKRKH